jgi:hypothetical protein
MVTTHTPRNVTDGLNRKCYSSEILNKFKRLVLANTAATFKPVKLAVSFYYCHIVTGPTVIVL